MYPKQLAEAYFTHWQARDFDAFRALLADDCTFTGPMGTAKNADECTDGIRGMSQFVTGFDIQHVFVDGPDVLTWYELKVDRESLPTANWMHIEDGKIATIRVAFDPRPIAPPSS